LLSSPLYGERHRFRFHNRFLSGLRRRLLLVTAVGSGLALAIAVGDPDAMGIASVRRLLMIVVVAR
jgi:hypothetical protein